MNTLLTNIREQQPLVLNVANFVTMQHVADAINVVGASPLMTNEPQEAAELVGISSAVVLNIGTLSEAQWPLFLAVGQAANRRNKPVILDPVAVGMPYRAQFVRRLLANVHVDIIRGNASEIAWFAHAEVAGRGIDTLDQTTHQQEAELAAKNTGAVIVQTGVVDVITDGVKTQTVHTNSPLLAINVGAGDMLSGLIGAFAAVTDDYFAAGVAATELFGQAGERASAQVNQLPGHFIGALFNELYAMTQVEVTAR